MRPVAQEAGFVLPMASAVSLLLLLSSLSIQTVVLQSRAFGQAQWRQRQGLDSLATAAQQAAIQLEGPGLCLLKRALQPCPMAQDPTKLLPPRSGAELVSWQQLSLAGQGQGQGQLRLRLRDSAIVRSYLVDFDPAIGRVIQVRGLGS
ncbi:hypothetical protein KBY58_00675 [Cyanobium sp. HWJ4-Hawea]|uniref:hypothetical protein n=1 Tax=Cyanobium sp. HWJ4-Hawea TaxID=2823713 RepID=UPI0020CF0F23|nr:hypothetical protein [Cyanobium sp. HWJ4-Hawea]MCP9807945.1 hypothetical protein [Cyanobium sp. HWJ4-Hawea]